MYAKCRLDDYSGADTRGCFTQARSVGEAPMRGPGYDCVPVSIALAPMLTAPFGAALAQDSNRLAAEFNERFPVGETSTPPPLEIPEVKKEHSVTTTRPPKVKRARVVVVPRSFLNAGTNVVPGDRKFLDYAFPPTHTALDVVSNTGARVGWHNSPLPGPFFPQ